MRLKDLSQYIEIDIDEALAMKKDINELYYKVAREISI